MNSDESIDGLHSPRQPLGAVSANANIGVSYMAKSKGLAPGGGAAWIERFTGLAVSHMASTGVMSLKTALEYLLEDDSKQTEP